MGLDSDWEYIKEELYGVARMQWGGRASESNRILRRSCICIPSVPHRSVKLEHHGSFTAVERRRVTHTSGQHRLVWLGSEPGASRMIHPDA